MMNTTQFNSKAWVILFLVTLLCGMSLKAQEYKLDDSSSEMIIYGTSNLHDWEIDAEDQDVKLLMGESDNSIKDLEVIVGVKGLKSGKGGMDKNTYKALDADDHENIRYKMKEVKTISEKGAGTWAIETAGEMTISGVTKMVTVPFEMKVDGNKVILTGEKSLKMTEFNVEPPTALFGTITTGDEVTIKFKSTMSR
ncbi:YceI family protein [Robertkochia aurantiaca]|uniref:YceI family protein n=1 Tax=Robertkochia aurantiaca TaxID=2873700 RepID=UPI001CCBE922|nr:YceI family protein [Robertkochia sp. 3YJGBD-33]